MGNKILKNRMVSIVTTLYIYILKCVVWEIKVRICIKQGKDMYIFKMYFGVSNQYDTNNQKCMRKQSLFF